MLIEIMGYQEFGQLYNINGVDLGLSNYSKQCEHNICWTFWKFEIEYNENMILIQVFEK